MHFVLTPDQRGNFEASWNESALDVPRGAGGGLLHRSLVLVLSATSFRIGIGPFFIAGYVDSLNTSEP
jgi:hypothetical protein